MATRTDREYTAVNLYTVYLKAMKLRSPADQKQTEFVELLQGIYDQLYNLLEDPLFIDSIHGEQEVGLDQTLELIDNIIARINPIDTSSEAAEQDRLALSAVDAD